MNPPRLSQLSEEELLDLEQDLLLQRSEDMPFTSQKLIDLYEVLFRKVRKNRDSEYQSTLDVIKRNLLFILVQYGTYLKTELSQDDNLAKQTLKKALTYDHDIPQAYYRLGFLSYKEEKFTEAISFFENALSPSTSNFKLTDQQRYHAQLFLVNSALYIVQNTQSILEEQGEISPIPTAQLSPLYEKIMTNNNYLTGNAFTITNANGSRQCSSSDVEEIIDYESNRLILYFSDQQISVFYKDEEIQLSVNKGEMLRHLLLYSSKSTPVTKHEFFDLFGNSNNNGEIPDNTYVKNISRLRSKLESLITGLTLIENTRVQDNIAYYYTEAIPFTIIHRSDRAFILS
jgi:tetratricopeptide (TPR) repeat protein